MRILAFTGGAGNMYCGSCLRDNALASALLARGHDVLLTPVYTPTRTDERNVSGRQVFFGGISVYLEQHAPIFRRMPAFLDRLWDSPWALRLAARRQIQVDPQSLGPLTVSMLRGEEGFQRKEIRKLLEWLAREPRFDIVNLPYALLIGLAAPLRRALRAPICCTLQGEDLFLESLAEPHRSEAIALIRRAAEHVDFFLPVSEYYMEYMTGYLGLPRSKMRLVRLGVNVEGYSPREAAAPGRFTIGYLARIAPEKGLHVLAEAYARLRADDPSGDVRLLAAGYLPPEHRAYLDRVRQGLAAAGLAHEFEYRGELDRGAKISFLQELDLFSVPTVYREPKGLFLLEAFAAGVPVVQPRVGAFPEMIEATGGGLLVAPDDPDALAAAMRELRHDDERRASMGKAGAEGVRRHYTASHMAEAAEAAYFEAMEAG